MNTSLISCPEETLEAYEEALKAYEEALDKGAANKQALRAYIKALLDCYILPLVVFVTSLGLAANYRNTSGILATTQGRYVREKYKFIYTIGAVPRLG